MSVTTIKEIAEKSGVAVSTVSKVLNNRADEFNIGEETKSRIFKVSTDLNYFPNIFAKRLTTKKSNTIGILSVDITDDYCPRIIKGIEGIIDSAGYDLILSDGENNEDRMRNCLKSFFRKRVSGVLILGNNINLPDEVILEFREKFKALAIIGRNLSSKGIMSIKAELTKGEFLAAEYLIKLGHKNIGILCGPSQFVGAQQRLDGYKMALEQYDIPYNEDNVVEEMPLESRPESGYMAMQKLLVREERCTAVLTFDDLSAFGAIRAIEEKGLNVPEDISVIGFDDIPAAAYYNPPLTTVRQPTREMGIKAATLLLKLISGEDKNNYPNPLILQPELILRNSCQTMDIAG